MLDRPLLMTLGSLMAPVKWNTFYALGHGAGGYMIATLAQIYMRSRMRSADPISQLTQKNIEKFALPLAGLASSACMLYFTSPMKISRDQCLSLMLAYALLGSGLFLFRKRWGAPAIAPIISCAFAATGTLAGYVGRPALLAYGLAGGYIATFNSHSPQASM
ncbi:MAG: hypothetical protein JSS10_04975 [Verrucomicrobia bacterium]|nr:hypothetical protein [Verrucomicrobiota bacterium]